MTRSGLLYDPAAEVRERARLLAEDLRLTAVAEHKARHPGSLAVGMLPVHGPRPLLEAMGCLPVSLWGGGDQVEVVRGDALYQSYICHLPRSVVELGLAGALDGLDAVLFPSTCDVIRNLSGMWQVLFPGQYVNYIDVPQDLSPSRGGRFYAGQLRALAAALRERGAAPLEPGRLWEAIRAENARWEALARLDRLRREKPWLVKGSEAYLVVRAGSALLARDHEALVRAFLDAAGRRERRPLDNVRVVLQGAFCEQPPRPLLGALEGAGCDVVEDDLMLHFRLLDGPIPLPGDHVDGEGLNLGDPLEALAWAYLKRGAATATRYVGPGQKGEALVGRVRRAGAEGVIFAAPSFCDPALLDQPMLERALDRAGIPHTSLKYAENSGQLQSVREQAGAFADAVRLWGDEP
jgi:benzoyl-CoA reductase subunit C